jgi:hypothetical protein
VNCGRMDAFLLFLFGFVVPYLVTIVGAQIWKWTADVSEDARLPAEVWADVFEQVRRMERMKAVKAAGFAFGPQRAAVEAQLRTQQRGSAY